MLDIIGGTYHEFCQFPKWNHLYGSGLRAAVTLSKLTKIMLHTCIGNNELADIEETKKQYNFSIDPKNIDETIEFQYIHTSATPVLVGFKHQEKKYLFDLETENALIYGMVEGHSRVKASKAVYDPQNPNNPQFISDTRSKIDSLVYVLNKEEAFRLSKLNNIAEAANLIIKKENAQAVIVKCGSEGAYVFEPNKKKQRIPAYRTGDVWNIGSGDVFSASFAFYWIIRKKSIKSSAKYASMHTANYVQTKSLPLNIKKIESRRFDAEPLTKKTDRSIYLAAPFFNITQLRFLNEVKEILTRMGFKVNSPYHSFGLGGNPNSIAKKDLELLKQSKIVFALLDDLDPGTIFEIGYARAPGVNIPVIIYANNFAEINETMFLGTGCKIFNDLTTAIYHATWY